MVRQAAVNRYLFAACMQQQQRRHHEPHHEPDFTSLRKSVLTGSKDHGFSSPFFFFFFPFD